MNTPHQPMRRPGPGALSARVVIAEPGLGGHDRGAEVTARALRDAAHQMIYETVDRLSTEPHDQSILEPAC